LDTLLIDRDHYTAGCAQPVEIDGLDALMQQALIRLTARRGSFAPDPNLGSRLWQLPRGDNETLGARALPLAQEALADLPQLQVSQVDCRYDRGADRLSLTVSLTRLGQRYCLEVEV
jgi:phage gp46-like protein